MEVIYIDNIEQLPSGHYRLRKTVNGKRYSLTFDHKPTKKEIEAKLIDLVNHHEEVTTHKSFLLSAQEYIDSKKNVLSPSTVKEYTGYTRRLPKWFLEFELMKIGQVEVNKLVNELSIERAPKTVRNIHGFVYAVCSTYNPSIKLNTRLPQKIKKEEYIPSDEDVKRILKELEGTEFYIPIMLACYGMRRGEVCALTPEDIEGDIVHINKSLAYNVDNEWVEKITKTTASTRDIIIPMELADMIRKQGYVYKYHPSRIHAALTKAQTKLKIPHFSLHKLRHYFASKMLTITDAQTVQKLGGWETDAVLKQVYAHSLKEEEEKAKRNAVKLFKLN